MENDKENLPEVQGKMVNLVSDKTEDGNVIVSDDI